MTSKYRCKDCMAEFDLKPFYLEPLDKYPVAYCPYCGSEALDEEVFMSITFTKEHDSSFITVHNKVTTDILGVIKYYPDWRKYVFWQYESTFFEAKGLREIADFLDTLSKNVRIPMIDEEGE